MSDIKETVARVIKTVDDEKEKSNALAKKFLDDLFESKDVDAWQAKLKQSPEVRGWAIKQFNDALVKRSNDNGNENE